MLEGILLSDRRPVSECVIRKAKKCSLRGIELEKIYGAILRPLASDDRSRVPLILQNDGQLIRHYHGTCTTQSFADCSALRLWVSAGEVVVNPLQKGVDTCEKVLAAKLGESRGYRLTLLQVAEVCQVCTVVYA